MVADRKNRYHINSILRAASILRCLAESGEAVKTTSLARRLGLDRSTVYRILLTLEEARLVERDEATGVYSVGLGAFEVGSAYLRRTDLHGVARPLMVELSQKVGETVHLAVPSGNQAIYLDKIDRSGGLGMISRVGAPVALHCTGCGKVILAFQPDDIRENLLTSLELSRFTPNTITTKAGLRTELEETIRRGYALDRVEHEDRVACVAVPIFNHAGELLAAISVSGASSRILDPEEQGLILREVVRAGRRISGKLGYQDRKMKMDRLASKRQT